MNLFRKVLFIITGLLCVGFGILGIITPLLPTTPFLLLAALLFANASPALHSWLHRNRVTGPFLKAYTEGTGMSRKHKAWTITVLWVTLAISAYISRQVWWVPLVLACVGFGVTIHIVTLKDRRGGEVSERDESGAS